MKGFTQLSHLKNHLKFSHKPMVEIHADQDPEMASHAEQGSE